MSTAVQIAESKNSSAMYAGRPYVLLERGWLAFRSSTWIPVVTGFVEPVLFLLAFGYGMGNLIGDVSSGGTTIDYTAFIAPGLLANSAMNGAIYDSTWNVFWKLNESKLYKTMLSTPLGPLDIALGEITWALLRGLVYSLGFLTVVTLLGITPSFWAILAIPAASLVAFGFASFGMAITSYFKTYQQMGFINIILLPITLFSGSLYPISIYPDWLEKVIMALPLWHGIELVRACWFGNINSGILVHVAYFVVMISVGLVLTSRRLRALFLR
ncbi:TagG ABC-type polysaccharide/polyol phosphate export systems, permease component [Candidatus Nanopelagicaceae bacterium]